MASSNPSPIPELDTGEPAWEIARLFPDQGSWSEDDYLDLNTNQLVEFTDGRIEVLVMPTMIHQLIFAFLFDALRAFVNPRSLGVVLSAPFRVRLRSAKYREPDVVFMLSANADRIKNAFWDRADLVMEVVSADDRRRDLETKRVDYAKAGISEYWIVDPQLRQITVLKLDGDRYDVHGTFKEGEQAASALLPGFQVDVIKVFEQGQGIV
jgi:Uma2 family endonuclease